MILKKQSVDENEGERAWISQNNKEQKGKHRQN